MEMVTIETGKGNKAVIADSFQERKLATGFVRYWHTEKTSSSPWSQYAHVQAQSQIDRSSPHMDARGEFD
ncbi:hypothetical protein GJ744_005166 [Endocarpon pusillum]|uniref:Uncharacterized protein n=1 Tax=Endocarpon pusillum TaxID=364733 RepID=A0A8H7A8Y4_9EURO|nr:hypothetical protein GJ744_005166 [Endocarpon pusillum]